MEHKEPQSRLDVGAVHPEQQDVDACAPAAAFHVRTSWAARAAAVERLPAAEPRVPARAALASREEQAQRAVPLRASALATRALTLLLLELRLPAPEPVEVPQVCGDGEHLLQRQVPVRARRLQWRPLRDDDVSQREQELRRAHVSPSPSGREHARSGRR